MQLLKTPTLDPRDPEQNFNDIFEINMVRLRNRILNSYDLIKEKKNIRSEERSWIFDLFIRVIDFPFYSLRVLTILPCSDHEYNHDLTIVWPFFGILFIVANFSQPSLWWIFIIPLAFGLSMLFCRFRKSNVDEIPNYFIFINLLSLLSSVLWLKLTCGILIDLLSFVGILSNLSTTYLGLTVLAMGNALPDALTTIAIAK